MWFQRGKMHGLSPRGGVGEREGWLPSHVGPWRGGGRRRFLVLPREFMELMPHWQEHTVRDSQMRPKDGEVALLVLPPTFPRSRAFSPQLQRGGPVPRFALQYSNCLISHSCWIRTGKETRWVNAFQPNKAWARKHIIVSGTCLLWKTRQDRTWLALGWESSWEYWGWDAFPSSYPAGSPLSLPCRLALLSSYPRLNNTRTRGKTGNIALLQLTNLQIQVR